MFWLIGLTTIFVPVAVALWAWAADPANLKTPAKTAPYWGVTAALEGLIAVAGGAYVAHGGLPASDMSIPETAVRYHFIHGLALLGTALLAGLQAERDETAVAGAAWSFTLGLVFFCGMLYLRAAGIVAAGGLTPFGGILFMIGWLAFAVALWRRLG